jgi:hypothetical protein
MDSFGTLAIGGLAIGGSRPTTSANGLLLPKNAVSSKLG